MHMTKSTKWSVHPAKTQISLGIPDRSESWLCALWVAKNPMLLHADREDSDQTGWLPRLIRVFAGHTGHFVGFVVLQFKSYHFTVNSKDGTHGRNFIILLLTVHKIMHYIWKEESITNNYFSTIKKLHRNFLYIYEPWHDKTNKVGCVEA